MPREPRHCTYWLCVVFRGLDIEMGRNAIRTLADFDGTGALCSDMSLKYTARPCLQRIVVDFLLLQMTCEISRLVKSRMPFCLPY